MGRGLWIWAATLAACSGDKADPTPSDQADADTDADSDTDTDTDADTDSGTGPTTDTAPTTTPPLYDCYADETYDLNLDGSFDIRGLDGYDPVEIDQIVYSDRDLDHDGVIDQIDTWTWDAAGNITHHEQVKTGYATLIEDWSWDPYGNRIFYSQDLDGDGVADYTEKDSYDLDNELITASADTDGDGADDLLVTFTRDADGNALTREDDTNADGVVDLLYTFGYDELLRLISVTGDAGLDGTIDYDESTVYSDPVLEVGTTTVDDDGDGQPDLIFQFGIDAAGYETFYAEDANVDGTFEYTQTLVYDEVLDLLTSALIIEPGYYGTYPITVHLRWTYDAFDRETAYELSIDAPTLGLYGAYAEEEVFVFGGTCPS